MDIEQDRPEWNLNAWWLQMLGEDMQKTKEALQEKDISRILDYLDMWLRDMSSKVKSADKDAYTRLKNELKELNNDGTELLTGSDSRKKGQNRMQKESDFYHKALDYYESLIEIIDLAGLLRFKPADKDLKNYLKRWGIDSDGED